MPIFRFSSSQGARGALQGAFLLIRRFSIALILAATLLLSVPDFHRSHAAGAALKVNALGYFETRGLNVLVFNNRYDGNFSDSKINGIELIHHDGRTATNGDVRLGATPGQWDPVPKFGDRKVNAESGTIEASLSYPDYNFQYSIKAEAYSDGVLLSVNLEKPLPPELEDRAGFNLEFLPAAYFRKAWLMDDQSGIARQSRTH